MPHAALITGAELYYEVAGDGVPVLLIAGTGLPADVWHPHPVQDLQPGHMVITYDARAVGRSRAPNAVMTIEQMAADAAELLRHLDVARAHVVGHSMGGRVGLALALNYPGVVRSLVLAASGSGSAVRPGEEAVPLPGHRLLKQLIERGFAEHIRAGIVDGDSYFPADYRRRHPDVVGDFHRRAWAQHADLDTYLRQVAARTAFEATHRLPFLEVPVCLMVGSADVAGSGHLAASLDLANRIPAAELVVLEGSAHGFFWQQPEETAGALRDFFARH